MAIKNANSHPYQVEVVDANDNEFFANSHPYKVAVVGGHIGIEARIVEELPEVGESGYIYLVLKESTEEGDIYDEWIWALQEDGETYGWEHIGATNEVTIKLYEEVGLNTDGAMTQKATTEAIFEQRPQVVSFSLPSSGWASNTQTITVEGVTADNVLIVSPTVSSMVEYGECKVYASAQGTDSLTFVCDTTPANDLSGCVIIFNTTPVPEPAPDKSLYGRIWYKKLSGVELTNISSYQCTFEIVDNDLWSAYLESIAEETGGYFDVSWYGDGWYSMMGGRFIPEDHGVNLVATGEWAQFGGRIEEVYGDELFHYELPTAEDFNALYNPSDGSPSTWLQFSDGMDEIKTKGIVRFEFGELEMSSIGNFFLNYCKNLEGFDYFPDSVTTIGKNFLCQCDSLAETVILQNVTTIGEGFLIGNYYFNQKVELPKVEIVGNLFLASAQNFDKPIIAPNLSQIGTNFLGNCQAFNQPINISNLTEIPDEFLSQCYQFNQPLDTSNIVEIGNGFLMSSRSFNQPLDLGNVEEVGNGFLSSCQAYQQPISLPKVTSVGDNFLSSCSRFNQVVNLPSVQQVGNYFMSGDTSFDNTLALTSLTIVGDNFLYNCTAFNQSPSFMSNLTSIGYGFLCGCSSFNQPIVIPGGVTLRGDFLRSCTSFNSTVDLSHITQIPEQFIMSCSSFNQPLDLSGITSIGNFFLSDATAYSQHIVVPSSVSSIGSSFLRNCDSLATLEVETTTTPTETGIFKASLGVSSSSASAYVNGVTLSGSGAQTWKNALPDSSGSYSIYRKLILA